MVETTFFKDSAPTFDPLLGFPNGRVARVLNATQVRDKQVSSTRENIQPATKKILSLNSTTHLVQEEMEAVQLSPGHKNYCADLAIKAKVEFSPQMLVMVIGDKAKHDHHILFPTQVCHYESWPFGFKCNHIRHEVEHCMR